MPDPKPSPEVTKATQFEATLQSSILNLIANTAENPELFEAENVFEYNPRYMKIYDDVLSNNRKTLHCQKEENQAREQQNIKNIISKTLNLRNNSNEFQDKFPGHDAKGKASKTHSQMKPLIKNQFMNTITNQIGETEGEKEQTRRKIFFSQNKKVLKLEEECMLLEHYYKDKAKSQVGGVDVSYLSARKTSSSQHRRVSGNPQTLQRLYLNHNENIIEKTRKIHFITKQKFKHVTYKKAEENYSYKRERNFHQIQEILRDYHDNLLLESKRSTFSAQQVTQKQEQFNLFIRVFLKFASCSEVKRVYYEYLDAEKIDSWIGFLISKEFFSESKQKVLTEVIKRITENKIEYRLQFYDFLEFFETVKQKLNVSLLDMIVEKAPELTQCQEATIVTENWTVISNDAVVKRIKFVLKRIFNSKDLILKKYLPVTAIPKLFADLGLSENLILTSKIYFSFFWNLRRPEGLSFDEFFRGCMMTSINKGKWEDFITIFSKVRMSSKN